MMTKALAVLVAIALGYFAIDSYLSTRAMVKTLTDENKALNKQLTASNKEHNAEGTIGQQGLKYSQLGTVKQEKTQIEIHREIIREPCAGQSVPDVSAQRLWKLADTTRAATLSNAARESDSVTFAAAAGK